MKTYPISLEEFEQECVALTQEAINFRGTFDSLRRGLPVFFAKLKSFLTSRLVQMKLQLNLIDVDKATKIGDKIDYVQVRKMRVIVPKGLKAPFLTHLETLHLSQDLVDRLLSETLHPCSLLLGRLLNEPDTLRSQRENKAFSMVVLHDFKPVKERLTAEFSKDGAERRLYGEVVARQSDWPLVVKSYNDIVTRLSALRRDQILEKVNEISALLDRLIENMEADPQVYAASGVTVASLAHLAHAVATEVEHYAMHAFMIEQLGTSLDLVMKSLEKVGK